MSRGGIESDICTMQGPLDPGFSPFGADVKSSSCAMESP
jgi:hypothetical protein